MNRSIIIRPALHNRSIDMEATLKKSEMPVSAKELAADQIVLGLPGEYNLWDKRFKFRFISKHSGRKFDVNVKFQHIFRNNPEGEEKGPDSFEVKNVEKPKPAASSAPAAESPAAAATAQRTAMTTSTFGGGTGGGGRGGYG